ncbi:MAG TPA: hypothetical protein VEB22_13650 [Phycisphaerales bacterium]|nr:hypothetical protein [Phycisphaerales bacterium]
MSFKNLLTFALLVAAAAFTFVTAGGLAPEPSAVPKRWQLQVEFGPLRVYSTTTDGGPRTFFYQTYKAVNRSGQDVIFAPSFDLVDGDGVVTRSGRSVPDSVTKALMSRLGNTLMQDQISIMGTILQGEENAKEGLVVWPCENFRPGEINVYAAGFSGETALVKAPGLKDEKGKDVYITLRKTRQITFANPGDLVNRGDTPIESTGAKWIMR